MSDGPFRYSYSISVLRRNTIETLLLDWMTVLYRYFTSLDVAVHSHKAGAIPRTPCFNHNPHGSRIGTGEERYRTDTVTGYVYDDTQ